VITNLENIFTAWELRVFRYRRSSELEYNYGGKPGHVLWVILDDMGVSKLSAKVFSKVN